MEGHFQQGKQKEKRICLSLMKSSDSVSGDGGSFSSKTSYHAGGLFTLIYLGLDRVRSGTD